MTVIVKTIIIVNVIVIGDIAVIEIGNVIRRNVEIKRCNLCLIQKLDIVKAEWDSSSRILGNLPRAPTTSMDAR